MRTSTGYLTISLRTVFFFITFCRFFILSNINIQMILIIQFAFFQCKHLNGVDQISKFCTILKFSNIDNQMMLMLSIHFAYFQNFQTSAFKWCWSYKHNLHIFNFFLTLTFKWCWSHNHNLQVFQTCTCWMRDRTLELKIKIWIDEWEQNA